MISAPSRGAHIYCEGLGAVWESGLSGGSEVVGGVEGARLDSTQYLDSPVPTATSMLARVGQATPQRLADCAKGRCCVSEQQVRLVAQGAQK